MSKGWFNENWKHKLARLGISTRQGGKRYIPRNPLMVPMARGELKLQKAHFNAFAIAFRETHTHDELVGSIERILMATNPQFDVIRFREAAGIYKYGSAATLDRIPVPQGIPDMLPKATQKEFEAVAEAIKNSYEQGDIDIDRRSILITEMLHIMRQAKPQFDETRFRQAAGLVYR